METILYFPSFNIFLKIFYVRYRKKNASTMLQRTARIQFLLETKVNLRFWRKSSLLHWRRLTSKCFLFNHVVHDFVYILYILRLRLYAQFRMGNYSIPDGRQAGERYINLKSEMCLIRSWKEFVWKYLRKYLCIINFEVISAEKYY